MTDKKFHEAVCKVCGIKFWTRNKVRCSMCLNDKNRAPVE